MALKDSIIEEYILGFLKLQLPLGEANNFLQSMIKDSKIDGTYYLPLNLGDIVLGLASSNNKFVNEYINKIKETLDVKQKDGVTHEDIKWYWNCHELQRRLYQVQDDLIRAQTMASLLGEQEWRIEKLEDDRVTQIRKQLRKIHPSYYQFLNEMYNKKYPYENEVDRPLPIELKDRVNHYAIKRAQNRNDYRQDMEAVTSFNALVRKEIKAGNL